MKLVWLAVSYVSFYHRQSLLDVKLTPIRVNCELLAPPKILKPPDPERLAELRHVPHGHASCVCARWRHFGASAGRSAPFSSLAGRGTMAGAWDHGCWESGICD